MRADTIATVLATARSYVGSTYCDRGVGPACFDCSGFIQRAHRGVFPDLPRTSRGQATVGRHVARADLEAGDLVFFATAGRADVITHVALYAGGDTLIHAISDGPNRGVSITALSARYWSTRFVRATRLPHVQPATSSDAAAVEMATGTYSGEVASGAPSGLGEMQFANGDRYVGEFANGTMSGAGTYTWADGTIHSGTFNDGRVVDSETARATYVDTHRSAWDDWNGIVRGDFYAWQAEQEQQFRDHLNEFERWQQEQQSP